MKFFYTSSLQHRLEIHHLAHHYSHLIDSTHRTRGDITMVFHFEGVKQDSNFAFFYDDNDVENSPVPLAKDVVGDLKLTPAQLKEWFAITQKTLPDLPGYFIVPRLHSSWGDYYRQGTARGWWNIEGEMVVYKPIEWVPSVARIKDYPKNSIITSIKKEEMEDVTTKLYAQVDLSLEITAGGNYMGMKAEAKTKAESSVSRDLIRKETSTIVQEGKVGDKPLVEVAVGLMLRVEEVYTHDLALWIDDRHAEDSMGWSGGPGWNDIHVADKLFRHVTGLQFSNISTTGEGHSSSLNIQALPVFNKDGSNPVQHLHLALSCAGWGDWYAYTQGRQGPSNTNSRKLMIYPRYSPATTLMSLA